MHSSSASVRLFSIALASSSVIALAALSGCASETSDASSDPAVTDDGANEELKAAVIDETENNKTVPVNLGRSFTIALSQNASTGYSWSVKSVDKTIGQPKITTVAGDTSKPGASGLKKFTWSTKSALDLVGQHTIVLVHQRGSDTSTASTFTVTVDIKDTSKAKICGGFAGLGCDSTSYCDYDSKAACGAGDQSGTCLAKPDFCPAIVLPVCGCDGKTHNNTCEANRAGITVVASGPCAAN